MLRFALLAATLTLASAGLLGQWAVFKDQFNRRYSPREDTLRRSIFEKNLQLIEEHNTKFANGESSFYLGVNRFADMTFEEFRANVTTFRKQVKLLEIPEPKDVSDLPAEVDWVAEGYVTRVKDQGNCGSCWAFSANGALEGQHKKVTGDLVALSESQLVDCSWDWGNLGCDGGRMDYSFEYIKDIGGIQDDESYPYVDRERDCAFDPEKVVTTVSSYKVTEPGSESDLQEKVAEVGPISVAIDATFNFQFYTGGVLDDSTCSSTRLTHAVLAVGYGHDEESGKDYWLVKNSWGEYWGDNGYIKMIRNKNNQCGIATDTVYPLI